METLVIQVKNKKQAMALKAVSDVFGAKYKTMDELERAEDKWMGKLMDESNGEYLSEDEKSSFLKDLKNGVVGKK